MLKHKKLSKQGKGIISLPLMSLSLGSSLIWGCFDPANENGSSKPVEPLTHESAHAIISSTMQSQSQSLEERLRFLDGDERLMEAIESIFGGADEECYFDYDEEGNEYEVCESYEDPENEDNQIRIDFMDGTEEMISSILEELAPELQIAEETQLTYRLNVNRLCESTVEDDWEDEEFYDDTDPQFPDEEGF
jgi:hypothetical protein